jgi:hypothetical protein
MEVTNADKPMIIEKRKPSRSYGEREDVSHADILQFLSNVVGNNGS